MPRDPIVAAAMVHPTTGKVYTGANHGEAFEKIKADKDSALPPNTKFLSGFITRSGRILSREEARVYNDLNDPDVKDYPVEQLGGISELIKSINPRSASMSMASSSGTWSQAI